MTPVSNFRNPSHGSRRSVVMVSRIRLHNSSTQPRTPLGLERLESRDTPSVVPLPQIVPGGNGSKWTFGEDSTYGFQVIDAQSANRGDAYDGMWGFQLSGR